MNLEERIQLLSATGKAIESDLRNNRLDDLLIRVGNENPWFTKEFSIKALENASENYFNIKKLEAWVSKYTFSENRAKIALIPAGNIPLVGLHDLICVFVSGNTTLLKPSKKDSLLLNYVVETMVEIEPLVRDRIQIVDRLKSFDAVIATGSNNTHRYFEHYFGKYPSILRKNRTSIGIVGKDESDENLKLLCDDIYQYFGLGCRSVSKLYLQQGFDITRLLDQTKDYEWLGNQNKFYNNYMYNKSVYLVNRVSHFDTGFSIFKEDEKFHSPISVTFFEYFESYEEINKLTNNKSDSTQIIIGRDDSGLESTVLPFGEGQKTGLNDYADNIDTMAFLANGF